MDFPISPDPRERQYDDLLDVGPLYVQLAKNLNVYTTTLKEYLEHMANFCATRLAADRVSIWTYEERLDQLSRCVIIETETAKWSDSKTINCDEFPSLFRLSADHNILTAGNNDSSNHTDPFVFNRIQLGIKSLLCVGIFFDGRLWGTLLIEDAKKQRVWSNSETSFASAISTMVKQYSLMYDLLDDREHYQAIFTNMGESILFIQNMRFTDCNPAAIEMFRCSKGDLIGADVMVLSPDLQIDGNDSKVYAENKIGLGLAGQPQRFEWRFQRLDGEEFDGEVMLTRSQRSGDPTMIAVVRDISDRKNAEKDAQISRLILEQRARYDSLTGLRNRDSFHYDVSKVLEGKSGEETSFAVFLLDLNRFKEVNDTLGHKFGDLLLVQVAKRLADLCREEFSAYRLGGDEFVVSGPTGSARDAEQIAVQIARELKAPFDLDNIKLQLDGSIGIALYPQHGEDSHSLLRSADVAMYQAKQKASGQAVYDKANDSHNERRLTLMTELANAIEASQLSLHYQPQIDIHSGNCIGCEALLRWEHPTHGRIPPDEFIPIAELNTVIHDLTFWVLTAAIEQISAWRAAQVNLNISVNISALSLMDANFVDRLKALLSESRLPTSCLTLEITESALIGDPDRAYRVLHGLQEQGVSIAIDDFGTGYSSLSYLKRLPVHTLKIDRSFVRGLIHNDTDATIVRSVIELSKSFGLKSVAEGVEDGETQAMLASLGCDYAQGYHFCRPVPGKEFLEWYNNR